MCGLTPIPFNWAPLLLRRSVFAVDERTDNVRHMEDAVAVQTVFFDKNE